MAQIIGKNTSSGTVTAVAATSPKLLYGTDQQVVLAANQKLVSCNVYWGNNGAFPTGNPVFEVALYDLQAGANTSTAPRIDASIASFNFSNVGRSAGWVTVAMNVDMTAHAGKTVGIGLGAPLAGQGFGIPLAVLSGAQRKNHNVQGNLAPATLAGSTVTPNQAWAVYFETADLAPTVALSSINSGTNTVVTGSVGNTAITTGMPAATGMTIGGRAVTNFAGSANSYTFDYPAWVNNTPYITGAQTAIITDGTNSPTLGVTVNDPAGWSTRVLAGTLNQTNTGVLFGLSPAAVAGDRILYKAVPAVGKTTSVDAQGNIITTYVGTQEMWHIETATGIMRQQIVVTGTAIDTIGTAGTITMDGGAGSVTNPITTINMTALTALKIETLGGPYYYAVDVSVPVNSGSFRAPLWVRGQLAPYLGSVRVTGYDGTREATTDAILAKPTDWEEEQFTVLQSSSTEYLQNWMLTPEIDKPLLTGEWIYWETGNGLSFSQASLCDCIDAMTTQIFIHRITGFIEAYDLTIAAGGNITAVQEVGGGGDDTGNELANKSLTATHLVNRGLRAYTL